MADKKAEERHMIRLTRLNHAPMVLNSDLIEHIEVTPDTVISLTNGQKTVVLESANEVVRRVIEFRRSICNAELEVNPPFAPGELEEPPADEDAENR